jgi:hypothetical protein
MESTTTPNKEEQQKMLYEMRDKHEKTLADYYRKKLFHIVEQKSS